MKPSRRKNVVTHMTAGAIAGVMEHCVMYPLDSVKTRMQSLGVTNNMTVFGTLRNMVQQEGVFRPVRGMSAVVMGAGPAHALYFSTYEYSKESLSQMTSQKHKHLVYGASGCLASLVHDGISNPTEAYEYIQNATNKERGYNPAAHMISGAVAGAIAAAATTPLDVCKTVLNTQEPGARAKGFVDAVQHILRLGGPTGFFRGIRARVLYQMPAAAICWSTYETFKFLLTGGTEADSLKAAEKIKADKDKVINLRLVLPQASVKAENSESETTSSSDGLKGLKTMELPAVSGANLYGTLSLNTVHHGDCQVPTLRNT